MTDPWTILAWLIVVVIALSIPLVIVAGVFALRQQQRIRERMRHVDRRGAEIEADVDRAFAEIMRGGRR